MRNSSLTVTANMLIQLIHCLRGEKGFLFVALHVQ